jgi:putative sterol carrier protein
MLKETMLKLPDRFNPKMAGNLSTVIQFNFTGDQDSYWVLSIGDGMCSVAEGMVEEPQATVTMTEEDFIGINSGEIPAPELFWGGNVEIEGDIDAVIGLAPIMDW